MKKLSCGFLIALLAVTGLSQSIVGMERSNICNNRLKAFVPNFPLIKSEAIVGGAFAAFGVIGAISIVRFPSVRKALLMAGLGVSTVYAFYKVASLFFEKKSIGSQNETDSSQSPDSQATEKPLKEDKATHDNNEELSESIGHKADSSPSCDVQTAQQSQIVEPLIKEDMAIDYSEGLDTEKVLRDRNTGSLLDSFGGKEYYYNEKYKYRYYFNDNSYCYEDTKEGTKEYSNDAPEVYFHKHQQSE